MKYVWRRYSFEDADNPGDYHLHEQGILALAFQDGFSIRKLEWRYEPSEESPSVEGIGIDADKDKGRFIAEVEAKSKTGGRIRMFKNRPATPDGSPVAAIIRAMREAAELAISSDYLLYFNSQVDLLSAVEDLAPPAKALKRPYSFYVGTHPTHYSLTNNGYKALGLQKGLRVLDVFHGENKTHLWTVVKVSNRRKQIAYGANDRIKDGAVNHESTLRQATIDAFHYLLHPTDIEIFMDEMICRGTSDGPPIVSLSLPSE